jgi:hypothetical protein
MGEIKYPFLIVRLDLCLEPVNLSNGRFFLKPSFRDPPDRFVCFLFLIKLDPQKANKIIKKENSP